MRGGRTYAPFPRGRAEPFASEESVAAEDQPELRAQLPRVDTTCEVKRPEAAHHRPYAAPLAGRHRHDISSTVRGSASASSDGHQRAVDILVHTATAAVHTEHVDHLSPQQQQHELRRSASVVSSSEYDSEGIYRSQPTKYVPPTSRFTTHAPPSTSLNATAKPTLKERVGNLLGSKRPSNPSVFVTTHTNHSDPSLKSSRLSSSSTAMSPTRAVAKSYLTQIKPFAEFLTVDSAASTVKSFFASTLSSAQPQTPETRMHISSSITAVRTSQDSSESSLQSTSSSDSSRQASNEHVNKSANDLSEYAIKSLSNPASIMAEALSSQPDMLSETRLRHSVSVEMLRRGSSPAPEYERGESDRLKHHLRSNSHDTSKNNRRLRSRKTAQQVLSFLAPTKLFDFLVVVSLTPEDMPTPKTKSSASSQSVQPPPPPTHLDLNQQVLVPKVSYIFPPMPGVANNLSRPASSGNMEEMSISNKALLGNIPLFCFPEWGGNQDVSKSTVFSYLREDSDFHRVGAEELQSETFSFVLTDVDGTKRFGYCRRLLSENEVQGEIPVRVPLSRASPNKNKRQSEITFTTTHILKKKRLPAVYCIVSPIGCFSLFSQVLDIVEKRHLSGNKSAIYSFLKALMAQPFPKPGKSITVKAFGVNQQRSSNGPEQKEDGGAMDEYVLHRPVELTSREHVSFHNLLAAFGIVDAGSLASIAPTSPFSLLVTVLGALLKERRIILASKSLQKLSDCAHALLALVAPFEWQHVFIPILPRRLIDFVCSPTPFIVGILQTELGRIVENWTDPSEIFATQSNGATMTVGQNLEGKFKKVLSDVGHKMLHGLKSEPKPSVVLPVDEALVVHLDHGSVLRHDTAAEDRAAVPLYLQNQLRTALDEAFRTANLSSDKNQEDVLNAEVADAFMKFFLQVIGPYREFVEVDTELGSSADIQPLHRSASKKSKSKKVAKQPDADQDLLLHSSKVRVWFEVDKFVNQHPLVLGIPTVWSPRPIQHAMRTNTLSVSDPANLFAPSLVPSTQRIYIRDFLNHLKTSQMFQSFIQEREEAFQYHYQLQLEKAKWTAIAKKDKQAEESGSESATSPPPKSPPDEALVIGPDGKIKELPSGLKHYYLLSQSKFEKKVTLLEMMHQERMKKYEQS